MRWHRRSRSSSCDQTVIIDSATDPNSTGYVEDFKGDGYIASAVVNAVAFITDFFTPTILGFLGLKYSLFLGWISYAFFVTTLYFMVTELMYIAAVVYGVGNAMVSVAAVRLCIFSVL